MTTAGLLPPIPLYLSYAANETADAAAAVKSDGQAQALISHFRASAGSITSPDALLSDYKSLEVVLGAFGISNQINNTAILRKLLTQDPASKTSVAYQLGQPKILEFAKALSNCPAHPLQLRRAKPPSSRPTRPTRWRPAPASKPQASSRRSISPVKSARSPASRSCKPIRIS